jgi:hypothetical protein
VIHFVAWNREGDFQPAFWRTMGEGVLGHGSL